MLKSNEKYNTIYFWGKIFTSVTGEGKPSDYYIAYGLRDSEFEFPSKSFFYATDNYEFKAFPLLSEEVADSIVELQLEKAFTGVPGSPLVDVPEGEAAEEGQDAAPVPGAGLTEELRLAQVVLEVDFDTAAVPKGAYALNEAHLVVPSMDFKGLGLSEAAELSGYVHFRAPTSVASLRALARDDANFYANFLDPLEEDLPKGCWAVRQDPSVGLVTLRSLSWPGYVAFHCPGST